MSDLLLFFLHHLMSPLSSKLPRTIFTLLILPTHTSCHLLNTFSSSLSHTLDTIWLLFLTCTTHTCHLPLLSHTQIIGKHVCVTIWYTTYLTQTYCTITWQEVFGWLWFHVGGTRWLDSGGCSCHLLLCLLKKKGCSVIAVPWWWVEFLPRVKVDGMYMYTKQRHHNVCNSRQTNISQKVNYWRLLCLQIATDMVDVTPSNPCYHLYPILLFKSKNLVATNNLYTSRCQYILVLYSQCVSCEYPSHTCYWTNMVTNGCTHNLL